MFRHSCGICHYTNLHRPSDITLADFWGWEKSVPEMNADDKGISLILTNTPKGEQLLEMVKEKLIIEDVDLDNIIQPQLKAPVFIDEDRIAFERTYKKKGFEAVIKEFGGQSLKCRITHYLKRIASIPVRMANKIKRLLRHRKI